MNIDAPNSEQRQETLPPQQEITDGRTIPGTSKRLPSSMREDTEFPAERPLIQAAGVTNRAIDITGLSIEERAERKAEILLVIMEVEDATQLRASPEQRTTLVEWLAATRYSLRQIRSAGESVAVTETFGRPFAREYWIKAFARPLYHLSRVMDIRRQAHEEGYKMGRASLQSERSREAGQSGMDAVTKRLLKAEKELMTLREERTELKARIHELERECRALQRHVGELSDVPVYRKGDRLIVEHYRKDGFVYYHEQRVDETDIPASHGRRMPEGDFDRQIAEQNVSVLTKNEIIQLPGSDQW